MVVNRKPRKQNAIETSSPIPRTLELLQALNAASATIQKSLGSEEQIYQAFSEQVSALGLRGGLALLDKTGESITIRAIALPRSIKTALARFEKLLKIKTLGYSVSIKEVATYQKVVETLTPIFKTDSSEIVSQLIPQFARKFSQNIVKVFGRSAIIYAPLLIDNHVIGILNVAGKDITEEDVPAIQAFANHIAIAVTNQQLYWEARKELTERRLAEEALRRSEIEYRSLFENIPDGIYRTMPDGHILSTNPALAQMFGYDTEEEFKRAGVVENLYLNPADREKSMRKLEEDGEIINSEFAAKRRDGSPLFLLESARAIKDDEGRTLYYEGVLTGITERKKVEEVLRRSEVYFRSLIENTNDIITVIEIDGTIRYQTPSVERILGYKPEEMIGRNAFEFLHPDDLPMVLDAFTQGIQDQSTSPRVEFRFRHKDGFWRLFEGIGSVQVEENDQVIGIINSRDITERKRTEEAEYDQRNLAEALRDTAETLSRSLDLRSVLDQILNIAGRVVPHDSATIMLIEDGKLHLAGSQGYEKRRKSLEKTMEKLNLEEPSNLKQIFESRQAVVIPDVSAYPHWKQLPGTEWLRSNVGAPLLVKDNVIGFLFLDSGTPGFFTPLHAQRLQAFADQAAIAVQNARLFEAAQVEITERRQAEEKLTASESELRALFAAMQDVVLTIDKDGIYRKIAPTNPGLLIQPPEELLGKSLMDVFSPEQAEEFLLVIKQVLRTKQIERIEYELLINGSVVWFGVSITPMTDDLAVWVAHDITYRKEAQKAINRQLEELTTLHRVALAGIQSGSVDELIERVTQTIGEALFPNHFGVILLDESENVLRPHPSYRGLPSKDTPKSFPLTQGIAGRVASSGQSQRIGDVRLDPDYFPVASETLSELCVPIQLGEQVIGILNAESRQLDFFTEGDERLLVTIAGQAAVAIDNFNLFKRLQLSNIELERRVKERTAELSRINVELTHANRTKDEFLATMSHELRTPLNSVLGFSESLLEQRRGPLNEKQEQYVSLINSSGQHLLGLINDILQVSKIEAGKLDLRPDIISVKEVCESSLNFIKEMAAKKSIRVEFKNESSIASLRADPQRLKQVLVNLLNNAVKFTPEKGKISLEVRLNNEKDQIQFSVTDNGIGIAHDDLSKLFIPFSQIDSSLSRQYEGTGLGLALVLRLTELHGGSVKVESEPNKGSRFTINLPWSENQITRLKEGSGSSNTSESVDEHVAIDRGAVKILLAEDNLSNVLTIQEYLSDHGYKVDVAHNGVEAIAMAKESSPNIILMDIQMPVLNGLDATRRLRADPHFATTPIIALTALAMPGDRERCLEAGANEYLSKPISLKGLMKTIGELLAQ